MPPTREAWLMRMSEMLRPWFKDRGYTIPARIRFSMAPLSATTLGLAFSRDVTADGHAEIFISTRCEPQEIGETLVHELVHVVVGSEHGHKGPFRDCALAIGLTGAMKDTAVTPPLAAHLATLATLVGPYPAAAMHLPPRRPRNANPAIRLFCPGCKSVVRVKYNSYRKGVRVTCFNMECRNYGGAFVENNR